MLRKPPTDIVRFMHLFPEFGAASWHAWRVVLSRLTPAVRELFVIAGRGSGKSRIIAVLAAFFAVALTFVRAVGESIYVGIFAPDRKQATVTFRYIHGLLHSVPALAAFIEHETRESITLRNGVIIEVLTASKAAPRGRSYALAIVEEASMLPAEEASADPDIELLRALRPALARVPGSLLAVIGSPYARRGVLYDAWKAAASEDTVVVAADTLTLNPSFNKAEIDRAFAADPISAASEYGRDGVIEFRSDVSSLLSDAALAAVVPVGVRELAPTDRRQARAGFDAATGAGSDAAALGIAFTLPAELACVRRWRPPFSPTAVVSEAASLCRAYGIHEITIDRFAPGLIQDLFREHCITCRVASRDTSATFIELLALINSQRVVLLDDAVSLSELRRLERRPGAGRDLVGHPPRGHDDVAAAVAHALVLAATTRRLSPASELAALRQAGIGHSRPWGDQGSRFPPGVAIPAASPFDELEIYHPDGRVERVVGHDAFNYRDED